MPGGLPEVTQRFDADASGYVAAIQRMIASNRELISSISDAQRQIAALKGEMAALGDKRVRVEVTGVDEAIAKVGELRSALDGLGDRHISVGGDNGAMIRELRDISASMDMATSSMGRMEEHLVVISKNAQDSSADLMMQTQILRDNADAHHAAATAAAAFSAAQAAGGGRGGGRGAIIPVPLGGGGGGGGGGFPAGSAGAQADAIVGFVKRWWGPVHWAMMATNEILATAGPALAAAGAATLVGWQGVEQMIPRFQAINAAAESIGPAYGITSGQYLGTGRTLQNFQNLATGGVYELGGAGINLARGGAGAFGQMGLNTIAMLDRGVAGMQVNMAQRGTMGTLAGLLGGGTDYLREFGDIGANVGNIFLGLGPHLPGVGGDYLAALKGITGAAAGGIGFMNQHGMGDVLGLGLAGEAGARVGTPMVGLLGRLISSGGAGIARMGLGTGLGDAGLGIAGFGDALGMLGGPEVAALAMTAFGASKLLTYAGPQQRQMAALQSGVANAGFTGAWQPLAHAITTATGLEAARVSAPFAGTGIRLADGTMLPAGRLAAGQQAANARALDTTPYQNALTGFTGQLGDLVGAGPQLVADLKKAGLKSVSMGDAFQIAQNSLLDLTHAFDKHGNLTRQAQQMLTNYVSAIGPMTRSGGAFNAAVGAQQIMSSPAMQNLSKVNQAMDSMSQIMTGGPAGMATLFGMLGGTPTTVSHGGMRLAAGPGIAKMAQALTSFTTPGGAAAWNTFAGSQGLIAAEQQNLDQLRTAMTLGAIGPGGAAGLAGFQIQQMLPMARKSPAALAMLMQQGQQMGVGGYYDPSKSQAANYQDAVKAFGHIADSAKQANAATNAMTVHLANIPAVAKQFVQGTGAQIQAQQVAKAAQDAVNIKGGINIKANTADLVSQLRAAGVQGGAALKASLDAVLRQAGVGKAERIKIEADVSKAQAQINGIHGKAVTVPVHQAGVAAVQAAINSVHGKSVTITITTINRVISQQIGALTAPGGIAPMTMVGGAPQMRIHAQTGGLVPGHGFGDIVPAMLEPGEAIIPRYLVPLIAPILAAHRVPGFGGMPQGASSHFAAGGIVPHMLGFPDPTIEGKAGQFAWTLIDGLTKALNSAGAGKLATALIAKIGREVALARNVSAAAMQGQGFGNTGLIGGMDPTQGSVGDQMTSYLGSVKGFTGDIATLRKGHLNKAIISQLIAAGPVAGDALAQSILTGGGTSGNGIGQVNQLWAQLGHATKGLGAQAAMAQYGGMLAPNLKSGTVSIGGISININAPGGTTLALTPGQIKQITAEVQAALLKQARRNNKTGVQLPGKGA